MEDEEEEVLDEYTKRLRVLANRFLDCRSYEELDQAMNLEDIETALREFPETPTELLAVYTMSRQKISDQLDYLPEDALTWHFLTRAAVRLGAVYLFKVGYLLTYTEQPEGMIWRSNPIHPIFDTLGNLKGRHDFLYNMAQVIFEQENLRRGSPLHCLEAPVPQGSSDWIIPSRPLGPWETRIG